MYVRGGSDHAADSMAHDLRLLFELTEPRGRQAAGLALSRGEVIATYSRPETASKMMARPAFARFLEGALGSGTDGPVAAVGHCRLVTDGSELVPAYNHPICVGELVGVHNGVMTNASRFRRPDQERRDRAGSSDSEVFFTLLEEALGSASPEEALARTYRELRGSAAISVLHARLPALLMATNFGSLFYAVDAAAGVVVSGSERKIVADFLARSQLASSPSIAVEPVEPGTGVVVPFDDDPPRPFPLDTPSPGELAPRKRASRVVNKNPTPDTLRRCARCILPESYPMIAFDADGVCNQCRKYRPQEFRGKAALEEVLSRHRSTDGSIDCVVGLSGGRDSSFGLHVLKKEFGMHPVGVTFDWLLTSRKARHNIAKISGALGVEVVYRTSDYERQAENIRKNIYAWLEAPDLGMMTFVQAGDKPMYHYGRKVREEVGVDLTVWCSGYQVEQREFFVGYTGIDETLRNNPRLYGYSWATKGRLAAYYALQTLKNPKWLNRSVIDNAVNFWHCFVAKDDFLYLFEYYPYDEQEVERVLRDEYAWEADEDYGENQWRMDDFHTSFINYCYYTLGGFSEFDEYRSNQVREGLLTRDEALELARRDNVIRIESLREFAGLVGFNLEHVLKRIDALPKLY